MVVDTMRDESWEMWRRLLALAIVLLALADGVLHLSLDFVLYRGSFFRSPLSVLFLLNFLGYIVLVLAFLLGSRVCARWRRAIDIALLVYAVVTFVAWLAAGSPSGQGLAYPSKVIEVLLVLALIIHVKALRQAKPARRD